MMSCRTGAYCEIGELRNFRLVPIHSSSMNLERQACSATGGHAVNRALPGAGPFAEFVMPSSINAIQANSRPGETCLFELHRHFRRNQNAVCSQNRAQPLLFGMTDKLINIGAHQGFAAAENQNFKARFGNLLNKLFSFRRIQLCRMLRTSITVAMHTTDVAFLGRIP